MRVSVAGISIDVPRVAFIFDLWRATPVFHRWGKPDHTACGIDLDPATAIPPRLAAKIGRPCATCWPELRAQPSLFTRRSRPGATRPRQEELTA